MTLVERSHQVDVGLGVDSLPAFVGRHQRLVLGMQVSSASQVLDASALEVSGSVVLGCDTIEVHPRVLRDVGHVTLVDVELVQLFNVMDHRLFGEQAFEDGLVFVSYLLLNF